MISFDDLYNQQVDKIYNYCFYKTGSRFIAEDLTSDTFLKFFKTNWPRLENPVGYLYKICRNIIIDYYRKTKHEFSLEKLQDAGIEMETYQNHEEKMLVEQILKEVNGLPEEQKEVLLMQYVQDLDNKTISQVIGKSESAVKSLAHRGLETLRETFSKEE